MKTGPSEAVLEHARFRAQGHCERCGDGLWNKPASPHHRLNRKSGGRKGDASKLVNSPPYIVILCGHATTPGSCHEFATYNTDRYDSGWLLRESDDPIATEMLRTDGTRFTLDADGWPEEVAA